MIKLYEPQLNERGEHLILEAYRSGQLSGHGPYVKQFEEALADYTGAKYAIAVNSGTAALETALYAIGIKEGDEVILPSFTIISCATAILNRGAVPVLVDVDSDSWLIDFDQTMAAITDRTKAIMPVDIFGHPTPISQYVRHVSNIKVVEDASQALGAATTQGSCGEIADAATFSFYPNKLITTGEGGAVTTNDPTYAQRARDYRNLCFGKHNKFEHTDLGMNFRMPNLSAAIGLAQLEDADDMVERKKRVHRLYRNRLAGVKGTEWQVTQPWAWPVPWMVAITTRLPQTIVRKKLGEVGIETREFFKPLHTQGCLWGKVSPTVLGGAGIPHEDWHKVLFPISSNLYQYGLYLPSSPTITESQCDYVCDTLKEILGH